MKSAKQAIGEEHLLRTPLVSNPKLLAGYIKKLSSGNREPVAKISWARFGTTSTLYDLLSVLAIRTIGLVSLLSIAFKSASIY